MKTAHITQGIKHIRPLQGGLDAWREQGYPVTGVVHS